MTEQPQHPAAPVVSAIVPLYNKGAFIRRTLASILAQHFEAFEVIVVDDGSTDDGPEIVRQCDDPRVRLVCQENAGPGAARNRGIQESRAPLIAFLDADDEWDPQFLSECVSVLRANPSCAVAVTGYLAGADRATALECLNKEVVTEGPYRLPVDVPAKKLRSIVDSFITGSTVSRREVVEKYGGFFARRCTYGEDTYLWLQVLLNHPVYIIRKPLVWYNYAGSSLGVGRKAVLPPKPTLTYPGPIRDRCPPEYRQTLERFFTLMVLQYMMFCIRAGQQADGRALLRQWRSAWRLHPRFYVAVQALASVGPVYRALLSVVWLRKLGKWMLGTLGFRRGQMSANLLP